MGISIALFLILHTAIWFSVNYQFVGADKVGTSLALCIVLSIPISICAFFSTKMAYDYFQSAWGAKFLGFGIGYVVFSILTWIYLDESPLELKNILTITLAFAIIGIQLLFHNS